MTRHHRRTPIGLRISGVLFLFGALWGAAEGMWLLAPRVVRTHRITPTTTWEWLILEVELTGACALLGALLSTFSAVLVLAWPILRRRPYRDVTWATALMIAPALPIAYLIAALLIERRFFGPTPHIDSFDALAVTAAGAVFTTGLAIAYRAVLSSKRRPPIRRLASILVLTIVLGAIGLYFRVPAPPGSTADGGPLVPTGRDAPRAPLLFIGLDSGNWDTIRPLVAQGSLPTFARLLAGGIHGDVEALWPPYWSGPAWAAILTGHPREEVGIWTDLMVRAPGLPLFDAPLWADALLHPFSLLEWMLHRRNILEAFPPPRTALGRPLIWELLSQAGVETGVVRFGFTYPADSQATFVVSDRVGHDAWDFAEVTAPKDEDLVAPARFRTELLAPFSGPVPSVGETFATVLPGRQRPRTPYIALGVQMLRTGLDIDTRTVDAAERVLRLRPNLPFLAVYIGGFDNACHAFWPYRFPEAYADSPPPPEDVAEFHGVIDRYLEFLDHTLAHLIAAYTNPPNIIIVSDHGHGVSHGDPIWAGWHAPVGIFIAAGPDFPSREEALNVSYYDVVPTVADVMGFAVPQGMHGASVLRRRNW